MSRLLVSLEIILDRSFTSLCLSFCKRSCPSCSGFRSVSRCPPVHFVIAPAKNDRLLNAIEFGQQAILPSLRFEAEFVDSLSSGLSFHLVSVARPFEVVPALLCFFKNGIEIHPHFVGLSCKPFFNGVRSVAIHPVVKLPESRLMEWYHFFIIRQSNLRTLVTRIRILLYARKRRLYETVGRFFFYLEFTGHVLHLPHTPTGNGFGLDSSVFASGLRQRSNRP